MKARRQKAARQPTQRHRSGKAHRRYTQAEAAAIDQIRPALNEGSGLLTLVNFANHKERPWSTLWSDIAAWKIHGEPFTEGAADELLQGYVGSYLVEAIRGTCSVGFFGTDVTLTYQCVNNSVTVRPGPDVELDQYLDWLLLEAIRSGQIKRLKQCQWQECGRFFVATRTSGRYHSDRCQDAASNARRAKDRADQRERSRRPYDRTFRR